MLIIIKHKQSARIKCKYNLFKPCTRSNQPRRIKTIISNDIFTSLRRKKVQSPASSSRNCSFCVRITFEEMESFPRFNRVCFLISALDRSSKVLSWVGSQFSISSAIPFSKHHFFQTDNQKAVLFTMFSLFKLFFSCGGERKPT